MVVRGRLLRRAALTAALTLAAVSSAGAQTWTVSMSGPNEAPPNTSPGTGQALLTLSGSNLTINATFAGLLGTTSAAHIHCCTTLPGAGAVGVATPLPSFPLFPLGVKEGVFMNTFDLLATTSYSPAFLASSGGTAELAMARLVAGMNSGSAYFNVHTTAFPGGEIRGFTIVTPEPGTMVLLGSGLAGIAAARRRRRPARG